MAIWRITGELEGEPAACMVDSVTMLAFGPIFESIEDVDSFLEWMEKEHPGKNARGLSGDDLKELQAAWSATDKST